MANYCVFRIQKIKSKEKLRQMYVHHYRTRIPDNVDPELTELNDAMITPHGDSFVAAFNHRVEELEYYRTHDFRKNGVMAYDILMEYSPEMAGSFDLEKWKEENVKWLQETFGKENVISVVYHYDEAGYAEAGAIHGHAVVLPVDENGRFNAKSFTGSREKMIGIQDSYAERMEQFGMERGLMNSVATHQDIKRFYAKLSGKINEQIPEKERTESYPEYIHRLHEYIKTERAVHEKEILDKEREMVELRTNYSSIGQLFREINELQERIQELEDERLGFEREFGSVEQMVEKARDADDLEYGIENYPDETRQAQYREGFRQMKEFGRRAKEKNKEQQQSVTEGMR